MEKLVRDNIPEIIKNKWEDCNYYIASEKKYIKSLLDKIVEEAKEVKESSCDAELKLELADLFEVIETLLDKKDISFEEIRKIQLSKKNLKWGFDKKIILKLC